jgi:hypothetical protein
MLAAIARLEKNFNDFKASFKQNDLKILVEPLHLSKLQFDEILDLEVFLSADSKRKDSAVRNYTFFFFFSFLIKLIFSSLHFVSFI